MYTRVVDNPRGRDTRNHLRLSVIQNFIRSHGVNCTVRRGTTCPCVDKATGQPRMNCGICYGVGYYFTDPIKNPFCSMGSSNHRIMLNARDTKRDRKKEGGYHQSGFNESYIYTFTPSDGDLIKPAKDIEVINDESHVKGGQLANGQSSERLYHEDVVSVDMIIEAISNYSDVKIYTEGTHFNLNGNLIEWVVGQDQPADGVEYKVRYTAHPSYIILNYQPYLFTEHDEDLPKQWRERIDTIMPYRVTVDRIDRAILGNRNQIGI